MFHVKRDLFADTELRKNSLKNLGGSGFTKNITKGVKSVTQLESQQFGGNVGVGSNARQRLTTAKKGLIMATRSNKQTLGNLSAGSKKIGYSGAKRTQTFAAVGRNQHVGKIDERFWKG